MAEYKQIFVAVDFTPAAAAVAARAAELAKAGSANVTLLHVVEYLPPLNIGDEPIPSYGLILDEKELMAGAKESLGRFAQKVNLTQADQLVLLGAPKQEIVRAAEEHHADLIVIGSHGRHGFRRLLGSTADGVLHNAHCDVLAVRIKA